MKVLLIVPAYNEQDNILKTVNSIKRFSKKCKEYKLDYVVINDGSTDNTKEVCEKSDIKHIDLIQNLGIGGAVQTGYIYANIKNYDIAVQFDGDGQHDIDSLESLLRPILNGNADFVIGSRFIYGQSTFKSTFMRRFGIRFLSFLIKVLTLKKISDPTSGFRAANKKTINILANDYPLDYPEPESIIFMLKNKIYVEEVQVNMFKRSEGISSITVYKSIYYMLKVSLSMICTSFKKRVVK